MARLRRVDCGGAGFTRKRAGRGFSYFDEGGGRIQDAAVLQRVRDLVIPPAWTNVWICPDDLGHIQAVGTDVAGRKQYLYHPVWRERRDREKFDHMTVFARALPSVRETTTGHLAKRTLCRERVLACAVRLLDRGFFRVGGEAYTEANGSFGLATIRKEHVTCSKGEVRFLYTGKSGQERLVAVSDPVVCRVVGALRRRRSGGDGLLAWKEGDDWKDVRSSDINTYLKDISGTDFTAKMFRTWHGTVLGAVALAGRDPGSSPTSRRRAISAAVTDVAEALGNTPAVCRRSYIDPRVIDAFHAGVTIAPTLERLDVSALPELELQEAIEAAVLDLIEAPPEEASQAA
jgi:DNA topoisomerase IB